jgi:hypothetical protein
MGKESDTGCRQEGQADEESSLHGKDPPEVDVIKGGGSLGEVEA